MQHFVLEQALNYLIDQGDADIGSLNGKTIYFALDDLPLTLNFICTNNRIFVTTDTSSNADVDIKLKSNVFLSLLQGEEISDLLKQDKIIIHGDVKTAQLLVDLLKSAQIDFEEILSQYTGDIIANQIGNIARNLKGSSNTLNSPIEAIKDELTSLLISPSKSKLYKNKNT